MNMIMRVFSAGYRIFFLLAGLFAVFAMLVWEGYLGIHAAGGLVSELPFAMAPHYWHAHEMIFGYGAAVIAGFLMTAAPNWVGGKGAGHGFFLLAAGVWVLGRIAVWSSGMLPPMVVAVVDLAFVLVLWVRVLMLLMQNPKPQQMIFLVVLAFFWGANLRVHLEWMDLTGDGAAEGLRAGLLTISALIMVLGGRVTPAFTRNAMMKAGAEFKDLPSDLKPVMIVAIACALGLPLLALVDLGGPVFGAVAIAAGLAALVRLSRWQSLWTVRQPILWSLHLGYAMNAAGLIVLGLAALDIGSEVAALHVLGIGAVGGMTVAVMSRAALGHSGRALVAPWSVAMAYVLIPLAAIARFVASGWPDYYYLGVLFAGALWIAAFALFVIELWPVFTGERKGAVV